MRNSAIVSACRKSLYQELNGILAIVQNMSEGRGPDCHKMDSLSDFYKQAMTRMAFFHRRVVQDNGREKQLCGRLALKYEFDELALQIKSPSVKLDFGAFQNMRIFAFALTPEERKAANMWINLHSRSKVGLPIGIPALMDEKQPLDSEAHPSSGPTAAPSAGDAPTGDTSKQANKKSKKGKGDDDEVGKDGGKPVVKRHSSLLKFMNGQG